MQSYSNSREVIHLQVQAFDDAGALEHTLHAGGWRVWRGDRAAGGGASTGPLSCAPGVGLLDLRGARDGDGHAPALLPPDTAMALAAPGREWVAVLDPAQLARAPLRHLVHDCCHDYVTLPCEPATLSLVLGHALGMARLAAHDEGDRLPDARPGLEGVVGGSEVMRQLARRVLKAAACDAPVFLAGETGTGKELVAAALHRHSRRRAMAFVGINCGAIPPSLMESELFGYERGAFTGAVQRKLGRVEQAHGGTLFLDEVADLAMESQASLLRFLEEGRVSRLGGQSPIRVDARIVSATHVDLWRAVEEGRFRADLYHRLRVIELKLPALRARGGDIVLLAQHALHRHAAEAGGRVRGFRACALRAMQAYAWPGNVRELINRVREAIVMAEGAYLSARDLQFEDSLPDQQAVTIDLARRAGERAAIERALVRHGQHVGQAANELGISRVTLYRLMLRHGLHEARPDAHWRRLSLVKGGEDG